MSFLWDGGRVSFFFLEGRAKFRSKFFPRLLLPPSFGARKEGLATAGVVQASCVAV